MSLSPTEIEFLEEYKQRANDIFGVDSHEAYQIAIVFAGLRRGCHFAVSDDGFQSWLETALEEQSIPHTIIRNSYRADEFFIATNESWIGKHNVTTDRGIGAFLDYPETAIDTYTSSGSHLDDFMDFAATTDVPRDVIGNLRFVKYIPALSEEAIQEAIQFENSCREFLRESSLDTSDINIEPIYRKHI